MCNEIVEIPGIRNVWDVFLTELTAALIVKLCENLYSSTGIL